MKRSNSDRMIAGVCSGIAKDLAVDAAIVRLGFVLAFLVFGFGPIIYLILWAIMGTEE